MESVLVRCEERVRSVADVEVEAYMYLVGDQSSLARSRRVSAQLTSSRYSSTGHTCMVRRTGVHSRHTALL